MAPNAKNVFYTKYLPSSLFADILAKPGYGLLIWKIATLKNTGR